MDGATLHSKIYAGRGKAAANIGQTCRVFRPLLGVGPIAQPFPDRLTPDPLDPTNVLTMLPIAFNSGDRTYLKPNEPGDPLWYADFDATLTRPGDYLQRVDDGSIWFIGGQQPLLPIMVVECNRMVRVSRPQQSTTVGAQSYNASAGLVDVLGAPTALWPASILFGGKQQANSLLPASVKESGWRILLPPCLPVVLMAGDIATDDLGRRYQLDGTELTDLGWRINAQELHA